MNFKKECKLFIRTCLGLLNQIIIPSKLIIFSSIPDFYDNPKSLFDYLIKEDFRFSNWTFVWLVVESTNRKTTAGDKRCRVIKHHSLRGIIYYLLANIVVTNNGLFLNPKPGRKIILNLWHGMPIKKIGLLVDKENFPFDCSYFLSTSKIFKSLIINSFNLPEEKVKIGPQPRLDTFIQSPQSKAIEKIIDHEYEKIIIWLPTYRKSKVSLFEEGMDHSFGVPYFNRNTFEELNLFLNSKNVLLIIKPHYLEIEKPVYQSEYSNIKPIKHDDLLKANCTIYEILKVSDGLISDYSSVIFDYLLLDKPIACTIDDEDLNKYNSTRGVYHTVFSRLDFMEKICSVDDFYNFVNQICGNHDSLFELREEAKKWVFEYDITLQGGRFWADLLYDSLNSES